MSGGEDSIARQIEAIVREVPGWTSVDQLCTLFDLAYFTAGLPGDIVEVGAWCGRATSVLGLAARRVGGRKVHTIDLFPARDDWKMNPDGTYSIEVRIDGVTYAACREHTVWKEPFERDIAPLYDRCGSVYGLFARAIEKYRLEDCVVAHRGNTALFAAGVPAGFRSSLVFIDGDHSYGSVSQDILRLEPFIVPGGWLCFDDAFSGNPGVDRAIREHVVGNPRYELCQQMTRKLFVARKKDARSSNG